MTGSSLFTHILELPSGFHGLFTVSANGHALGVFGPGQTVDFTSLPGGGVSSFRITGIIPGTDPDDAQAFPIRLAFDTNTASFTMQAIVPEPSTFVLAAVAFFGLVALSKRHQDPLSTTVETDAAI